MMAFDLHAALLLLLAFALGGALAFLLRRRAERRKMSYLAQATLLSLEDEPAEVPSAGQAAPSDSAPVATDVSPPAAAPPQAPPHDPSPDPTPDAAAEAVPPRAARPRRASGAKAKATATAERPRTQVPQEMIPLAPADPELPLGLPASPAAAKPKRPRARPVPERGTTLDQAAPPVSQDSPVKAEAAPGAATAGTPPPLLPAPEGPADDLKRLKGIGPQNERRLNALGIYHWRQIAAWSPEEVRWVGATLAFPGRIEREAWVAQAKALLEGVPPQG